MKIQSDDLKKLKNDDTATVDITGPVLVDLMVRDDRQVMWLTIVDEANQQMVTMRICRITKLTMKSGTISEKDDEKLFTRELNNES